MRTGRHFSIHQRIVQVIFSIFLPFERTSRHPRQPTTSPPFPQSTNNTVAMAPKKSKNDAQSVGTKVRRPNAAVSKTLLTKLQLALVIKSGKVVLGYRSTLKALRSGKAKLILISANTPPLRKSGMLPLDESLWKKPADFDHDRARVVR